MTSFSQNLEDSQTFKHPKPQAHRGSNHLHLGVIASGNSKRLQEDHALTKQFVFFNRYFHGLSRYDCPSPIKQNVPWGLPWEFRDGDGRGHVIKFLSSAEGRRVFPSVVLCFTLILKDN